MKTGIEVTRLSCERAEEIIFSGLSFKLEPGQALLVSGDNGAGKSTLLRVLCGLLPHLGGEIHWDDNRVAANDTDYLSQVLYVGHQQAVKSRLTTWENLDLLCSLAGHCARARLMAALQAVGLQAHAHTYAGQLSQGQRQRLALARLYVSNRRLWLLDEPFTALDRQSTRLIEQMMINHLSHQGMVILTSHRSFSLPDIPLLRLELSP